MKNWPEIVFNSHYLTAIEVKKSLEAGDVMGAEEGVEQLIDAMARSDRRAVKSQLARLMKHIIKWKTQVPRRSLSWVRTINNARVEIRYIQEETPSIAKENLLICGNGHSIRLLPKQRKRWKELNLLFHH